ncbi:MAG: hypothetical protein H6670_14680 [Anaerolineaceae bacterium]|nr:hypothetical protein [Anaerolineaceae bacterium]
MSTIFEPGYDIDFNCASPMQTIVDRFKAQFADHIIKTYGWRCETANLYITFHESKVIDKSVSRYSYAIRLAGKLPMYDANEQTKHIQFARDLLAFLQDQGCETELSAYFPIDS